MRRGKGKEEEKTGKGNKGKGWLITGEEEEMERKGN